MRNLYGLFNDYINWSLVATFSVAAALLSKDRLQELFAADTLHGVLSCALLLATLVLYFTYVYASRIEIEALAEVINLDKVRGVKGAAFSVILATSIVAGILIASTPNIMLYSSIYTLYAFCDIWMGSTTVRNVANAYMEGLADGADHSRESEAVFRYYFDNPIFLRMSTHVLVGAAAICCSLAFACKKEAPYQYGAYFLLMANLLISELVVWRWRRVREEGMRPLVPNSAGPPAQPDG